jgi:hypothetical protein
VDTANPEELAGYIKTSFELFGKAIKGAKLEAE